MLAVTMTQPLAHFAPVHKKPKLSLQTSSLSLHYTCSSRTLSVNPATSTAVTPTTINTFNNAYDLSYRPSPVPALESAGSAHPSRSRSPRPAKRNDRIYNATLPYGVRSILKNGTLRNESISASPCTSTRRIFFPQPKTVSFKRDLEEEVVTVVYTAKHLDLLAKTEEEDVVLPSIEDADDVINPKDEINGQIIPLATRPEPQEVSQVCLYNTSINTATTKSNTTSVSRFHNVVDPPTASCSSSKKRRWEWTLTPTTQGPTSILTQHKQSQLTKVTNLEMNDDSEWVLISMKSTDLQHTSKPTPISTSAAFTSLFSTPTREESLRPLKRRRRRTGNKSRAMPRSSIATIAEVEEAEYEKSNSDTESRRGIMFSPIDLPQNVRAASWS